MNLFQNCKLNTLEFVRNYHSIFDLSNLINHTLLNKYASSQNYYFNKEINDILSKNRTSVIIKYYVANSQIIKFYYYMQQLENKECMSKNQYLDDYQSQIQSLIQFDKYHHEIPLYPIEEDIILIFDLHYNNRRKLIYYEIKKQIEYQNLKNLDQHQKGIIFPKRNSQNENYYFFQQANKVITQLFLFLLTKTFMQELYIKQIENNILNYSLESLSKRYSSSSFSRNQKITYHEPNLDSNFIRMFNQLYQRIRKRIQIRKEFKSSIQENKIIGIKNIRLSEFIGQQKPIAKSISLLDNKDLHKIVIKVDQPLYVIKQNKTLQKYENFNPLIFQIIQQIR